ncbi:glycosyltransferase family 4 protein [Ruegeria sediminis]|uniref:Glycosyltransferase family 4 protein n=1 Tax=Ruegeria sediminis TaxID=2583820 RepID=A0ABY2WV58_9RHOB|nr:glycosyltransferase family 1 protein [Ruegeria sediminis]TMV05606.1 glycosyltransferase family 4 protein [Ruegeria sediminis]
MTIYVNARFLAQPLSGVQRYARELLTALDRGLAADSGLRRKLGPVVALHPLGPVADPGWQVIERRALRGGQGHFWEQVALARAARGGVLLSLGNSGPLLHPRQIICFHDVNVWALPEAFSGRYRAWHRALRPLLARRAAALITVSRFSAGELAARLGVGAERFAVIANSAGHIRSVKPDATVLRRHGLAAGEYLLTVGNRSPNKNLARLVDAHRLAGAAVPPLVVVGGAVPGLAQDTGGAGARLLGRVTDGELRALYEGAAGFVFPSLYEGFGIPPLEAMELGVPVLAARGSALPEVLGEAPAWFDPRDVADMARALRGFAGSTAAERAAMVDAGRARAASFTWEASAERLAALLARVQQPEGRTSASAVRPIRPRSVARLISRR